MWQIAACLFDGIRCCPVTISTQVDGALLNSTELRWHMWLAGIVKQNKPFFSQ